MRLTNAALVVLLQHSPLAPSTAFSSIPKFSSDQRSSRSSAVGRGSLDNKLVAINGFLNENDVDDIAWGHASGAAVTGLYVSKNNGFDQTDDVGMEEEKPKGRGSLAASVLGVASASKAVAAGALGLSGAAISMSIGDANAVQDVQQIRSESPLRSSTVASISEKLTPFEIAPPSQLSLPSNLLADYGTESSIVGSLLDKMADKKLIRVETLPVEALPPSPIPLTVVFPGNLLADDIETSMVSSLQDKLSAIKDKATKEVELADQQQQTYKRIEQKVKDDASERKERDVNDNLEMERIAAEKKENEMITLEKEQRIENERIAFKTKQEEQRIENERIALEKKEEEQRIENERIALEKKEEEERLEKERERLIFEENARVEAAKQAEQERLNKEREQSIAAEIQAKIEAEVSRLENEKSAADDRAATQELRIAKIEEQILKEQDNTRKLEDEIRKLEKEKASAEESAIKQEARIAKLDSSVLKLETKSEEAEAKLEELRKVEEAKKAEARLAEDARKAMDAKIALMKSSQSTSSSGVILKAPQFQQSLDLLKSKAAAISSQESLDQFRSSFPSETQLKASLEKLKTKSSINEVLNEMDIPEEVALVAASGAAGLLIVAALGSLRDTDDDDDDDGPYGPNYNKDPSVPYEMNQQDSFTNRQSSGNIGQSSTSVPKQSSFGNNGGTFGSSKSSRGNAPLKGKGIGMQPGGDGAGLTNVPPPTAFQPPLKGSTSMGAGSGFTVGSLKGGSPSSLGSNSKSSGNPPPFGS